MAIFDDGYYLVGKNGLTVHVDYTAWGWTHLVAGLVVAAAGFALFTGKMWARVVGVVFAMVSLLLDFAFIAAYPFWSRNRDRDRRLRHLRPDVHGREIGVGRSGVARWCGRGPIGSRHNRASTKAVGLRSGSGGASERLTSRTDSTSAPLVTSSWRTSRRSCPAAEDW